MAIGFQGADIQNLREIEGPQLVPAPISRVHIPQRFDDNDIVEVVVEGVFPSGCYRVGPHEAWKDPNGNRVAFHLQAYFDASDFCAEVERPFKVVIEIGELTAGQHSLFEVFDNETPPRPRGFIPISVAQSRSRDEFLYAPVDSAVIVKNEFDQRRELVLIGTFTNSCMRFNDEVFKTRAGLKAVTRTGEQLLEVLPILHNIPDPSLCRRVETPFTKRIPISDDIPDGRYLFYIRKWDGISFSKFDVVGSF
jgi:hypothetical protein